MPRNLKQALPFTFLRLVQLSSAVLVMALIAFTLNDTEYHGDKKINYGVSVGTLSTFYLLIVIIMTGTEPKLGYTGVYCVMEIVFLCLWISGFIVTADAIGKHGCSNKVASSYNPKYGSLQDYNEHNGVYNEWTHRYTSKDWARACNSAKASIAFSGLNSVLHMISVWLIVKNVIQPIRARYGGSAIWSSGKQLDISVSATNGLIINEDEPKEFSYETSTGMPENTPAGEDIEAAAAVPADNHTYSTADSSNNAYIHEKPPSAVDEPNGEAEAEEHA